MFKQLFTALLITLAMTAHAENLDDPMRPPMATQSAPVATAKGVEFYLYSTLIAQGRRMAVINGHHVGVGDRIGGAKVEEIMPARVKLRYAGKSRTIHMLPITVKKPSSGDHP